MILNETIELLRNDPDLDLHKLKITRVQVGVLLTAVEISGSWYGVSSTWTGDYIKTYHKDPRDFGEFSPGQILHRNLKDLFQSRNESPVLNSVKLAVINALSGLYIKKKKYRIQLDKDPFDLLDLSEPKAITIVGGFQSYIRKLADTHHRLRVLELNPDALTVSQKRFYVEASKAAETFQDSQIILITGFSLLNHTLDQLLSLVPEGCTVALVGPSAGIIPDILFRHGVNIIGSTQIYDPSRMFEIVAEAGAGFHLFQAAAGKICISADAF